VTTRGKIAGITVYQVASTWAYRVSSAPNPLTGARIRPYKGGFKTEGEALMAAVEAKRTVESGRSPHPARIRLRDFLSEWLESVSASIKPTTDANYRDNIDAYINPILGDRYLSEITVPTLNTFYRHLLDGGRRKGDSNQRMYAYWLRHRDERDGFGPLPSKIAATCGTTIHAARSASIRYRRGRVPAEHVRGLAPKSVKNVHRLLHRALADAVSWGYLASNSAEHAALPRDKVRGRAKVKSTWTVEELQSWLRVALHDRFAGMWVLAATTGMRRSELAGVHREQLDLDKEVLLVWDTRVVVRGHAQDSDGKTDSSDREISLDSFTVARLQEHLTALDDEHAAFGRDYAGTGHLMVWPNGRRVHPDTVTSRFNRLVDAAGVPRIRLHDVRHTYATLAMDAGVDPKIVSDRIGHANMAITLQIYTHRSTGKDRAMAQMMSDLITAPGTPASTHQTPSGHGSGHVKFRYPGDSSVPVGG
jgi:integrase